MNFLAHQYLSFYNEPIMVGNFLADTLRGKEKEGVPFDVYQGVEIHHAIDNYTDSHTFVLETRKMLYPYFGKYAAVVQDVYFDHFLARSWSNYTQTDLGEFTAHVYTILQKNSHLFNERASRTFHYMRHQNWLLNYAKLEGMDSALKGLSKRASFQSNMNQSIEPFLKHEKELKALFESFFPELELQVKKQFKSVFNNLDP